MSTRNHHMTESEINKLDRLPAVAPSDNMDIPIAIKHGGTGANSAANARTTLSVAAANHTHTPASIGAAASSHTHSLSSLGGIPVPVATGEYVTGKSTFVGQLATVTTIVPKRSSTSGSGPTTGYSTIPPGGVWLFSGWALYAGGTKFQYTNTSSDHDLKIVNHYFRIT